MIPRLDDDGKFSVSNIKFISSGQGAAERVALEPLGSKRKIWTTVRGELQPWLFKYARPNTGENWSEKLGCELANLLGVPAARAELASIGYEPGILVESIVPHEWSEEQKQHIRKGQLIHGNEILAGQVSTYDKQKQWGQREHSYERIAGALSSIVPSDRVDDILTGFAGLLVLDALIGNTDRHHENWALLRFRTPESEHIWLSPSYDHASSLGRELLDAKRDALLAERRVVRYALAGRGAIFGQAHGKHADNPLDLVRWAAQRDPKYFSPWLERARRLEFDAILELLDKMPTDVFGAMARRFCSEFLSYTLNELQGINV